MTWAAQALPAARSGCGASEPSAQHAAAQRASGGLVALLAQLADLQHQAAEIAQKLPQIAEEQLAASARSERAWEPVEPEPFLTANDIAQRLNVAPGTIRTWRRQGKLPPGIDLGGVVRWRPEVIDAWIAEREETGR